MKAALQNYQARMRRVLDYIDRHLDSDLDLETVSGVAAFSKFHFHRQFTATFGLSVHRYVCASSATPTIWSPPRSTFIASGFRGAARKPATSRSIANG
jgi:hypothetical protein